jgi:hypothetical protein
MNHPVYWTQFTFKDRPDLHVTHKYFGTLAHAVSFVEEWTESDIMTLCQMFFENESKPLSDILKLKFNVVEYFGPPEKQVRVLTLGNGFREYTPLFRLRNMLGLFAEDTYTPPIMHVTTDKDDEILADFYSYQVVRKINGEKSVLFEHVFNAPRHLTS